jgi:hypothetical protein
MRLYYFFVLVMMVCIQSFHAMGLDSRFFTENKVKNAWLGGKYSMTFIPLKITERLSDFDHDVRMVFDDVGNVVWYTRGTKKIGALCLRQAVEIHVIENACVKQPKEKMKSEDLQHILNMSSPTNLVRNSAYARSKNFEIEAIIPSLSTFPENNYKRFWYLAHNNSFLNCCSSNGIFVGFCSYITRTQGCAYEQRDCIGLYHAQTGLPFQYIPLPYKILGNSNSIALNRDGTKIAVFLKNNNIAYIKVHVPCKVLDAFSDVFVKCCD